MRRTIVSFAVVALLAGCGGPGRAERALESADAARAAGNYDVAEIGYRNVLRNDPQHAGALGGMGIILLERGVTVEAARLLALAKERAPRDPEVLAHFGRALAELGYVADAREQALAAVRLEPLQEDALQLVAETAMTREEFVESTELLESLAEREPGAVDLALGLLALRQGELPVARARVMHALEREPDLAAGHALFAVVQSQSGEPAKALASSRRAAELSPPRSVIRLRHAMLLIASGELDEASACLEEVTSAVPDFATAWRVRAQLALKVGDLEAAAKFLEEGLKRNPVDLAAAVLQAELWVSEGKVEETLRLMARLNEVHPPNSAIEFMVARAHFLKGERAAAREGLDRVLSIDGEHAGAILLKARMQLADGDASLAALAIEELVARRPDLGEAQLLLAEAYGATGRRAEASAILEQRAQAAGDDFLPHLQLALALRNEGRWSEARVAIEKAAELGADDLVVLSVLVGLDFAEDKFDEAYARVGRHLEEHPEAAMAHLLRAVILAKEDKVDDAVESLHTAINHDAGLLQAYSLLILLHRQAGDSEQVIVELGRFLEQSPGDRAALMLRGALLHETGRLAEAEESYRRLLEIDPGFGPALNNLASIMSEDGGDLELAYALARRAYGGLPNEPAVADTLGWILHKRGEYWRALPLLRQAAAGMPEDGRTQFHYGLAAYMMDEREHAKRAFELALEAGVDMELQNEIGARLAVLSGESGMDELRERIAEADSDVVARVKLGEASDAAGDARGAGEQFLAALEINPNLPGARMSLAALYSGPLGEPEKALEMAKAARELSPNSPAVAALIGRIAFAAGDHQWAYGLLREAGARGGWRPSLKVDCALAAYSLGRVDEARRLMTEALEAGADAEDEAAAKRFLLWTGDSDQLDPDEVLGEDSDYLPAMMAKARSLEVRGLAGEAASFYEKIRRGYPHFAPAKVGLARVLLNDGGSVDEAKDLVIQARAAFPNDPEVIALLAWASLLEEDYAYGAQLMRQVADSGREMAGMDWYVLGMCLHGQGEKEDARGPLEKALAANLREPEAGKVRAILGAQ